MARDIDSAWHALHTPYVCSKMVVPSPIEDDIITYARAAMSLWAEGKSVESGFAMSCEALASLQKVSLTEDMLAVASSNVTLALEDAT